ncbi:MAG: hypothetical protein HYS22_04830 [Deltaproteobacteria bacterium]|nr:hypothetical protein [Deltaproteobacteria bacterium]
MVSLSNHKQPILFFLLIFFLSFSLSAEARKKKFHPFDLFDHEMHTPMFEGVIPCETCHADPDSYTDRRKINRLGCHTCHNNPNPPLPGNNDCNVCHKTGSGGTPFPKPASHKMDWLNKHKTLAQQNPAECTQCHANAIFCINCHKRRDTIQQRMHRRNFKFFHSIEARANPHRCDACHLVNFCQDCHSGRGNSNR